MRGPRILANDYVLLQKLFVNPQGGSLKEEPRTTELEHREEDAVCHLVQHAHAYHVSPLPSHGRHPEHSIPSLSPCATPGPCSAQHPEQPRLAIQTMSSLENYDIS